MPSSISTASATSGSPVGLTGFVTPFGTALPDFAASTLISYGQTQALFDVRCGSVG